MPCWTVQTSALKLVNPNRDLFRAALESIGFTVGDDEADRFSDGVSVVIEKDGRVTVRASERARGTLATVAAEVNRAYSAQIVQTTAKRMGWTLSQKSPTQFLAQRRF